MHSVLTAQCASNQSSLNYRVSTARLLTLKTVNAKLATSSKAIVKSLGLELSLGLHIDFVRSIAKL